MKPVILFFTWILHHSNGIGVFIFIGLLLPLQVTVFGQTTIPNSKGDNWRYFGIYGVKNWSAIYPDCDDVIHPEQSPININLLDTHFNEMLAPIQVVVNPVSGDTVTMVNNGHTVNFAFNHTSIHLSGGNFQYSYKVAGTHFHWGSNNKVGSEHTINGTRFPLEMHIVSFDEEHYSNLLDAMNGINAIAVLSVLFTEVVPDNAQFDPITVNLKNVRVAGKPFSIPHFDFTAMLPSNMANYYRYTGSLTTPPCSANVVWTIFDTKQNISIKQVAQFRQLQEIEPDGEIKHLIDNWRSLEPLNGRIIERSFPVAGLVNSTTKNTSLLLLIIITSVVTIIYNLF